MSLLVAIGGYLCRYHFIHYWWLLMDISVATIRSWWLLVAISVTIVGYWWLLFSLRFAIGGYECRYYGAKFDAKSIKVGVLI